MISKPSKCGDCGWDWYKPGPETDVLKVGEEIVYLATKAIDEPWYCVLHRQHK
jgi:hypothetical protein